MNIKKFSEMNEANAGWVNIKVDDDVIDKVRRFSRPLHRRIRKDFHTNMLRILSYLSNINTLEDKKLSMSLSMLKVYLYEILNKSNSNSNRGFIIESYFAGLLGEKSIVTGLGDDAPTSDRFGAVDVSSGGKSYQLKTYTSSSITLGNILELCDYYVIFNPIGYIVNVIVIDGETISDEYIESNSNNLFTFRERVLKIDGAVVETINVSLSKLLKSNKVQKYIINIDPETIKNDILEVSGDANDSIARLWEQISELQYNIESLQTGVDKNRKLIKSDDYENIYNKCYENTEGIDKELGELKDFFTK